MLTEPEKKGCGDCGCGGAETAALALAISAHIHTHTAAFVDCTTCRILVIRLLSTAITQIMCIRICLSMCVSVYVVLSIIYIHICCALFTLSTRATTATSTTKVATLNLHIFAQQQQQQKVARCACLHVGCHVDYLFGHCTAHIHTHTHTVVAHMPSPAQLVQHVVCVILHCQRMLQNQKFLYVFISLHISVVSVLSVSLALFCLAAFFRSLFR